MVVVEHDQVQPSVEHLLVDRDIRFDRQRVGTEIQRLSRPCVGNVDQAEGLDLLRFAVLRHLKIFPFQTANEIAVPIDDAHVFFDVVHLDFEGDLRRWRRRGLRGWRRLPRRSGARAGSLRRGQSGRNYQTDSRSRNVVSGFSRTGGDLHGSPLYLLIINKPLGETGRPSSGSGYTDFLNGD